MTVLLFFLFFFFFFNDTATTEIYTLSLHDALPISRDDRRRSRPTWRASPRRHIRKATEPSRDRPMRSEEHTSELQSPCNLVCRLLLEKKKNKSAYKSYRYYLHRAICSIVQYQH